MVEFKVALADDLPTFPGQRIVSSNGMVPGIPLTISVKEANLDNEDEEQVIKKSTKQKAVIQETIADLVLFPVGGSAELDSNRLKGSGDSETAMTPKPGISKSKLTSGNETASGYREDDGEMKNQEEGLDKKDKDDQFESVLPDFKKGLPSNIS